MEYSICIRTLGTSGDKYIKLLDSIRNLNIQPKEVLVVIPHGYKAPSYSIEIETIVRSSKGMLIQRIVGYEEASSEYVLLLDDDVEFEPKIVEKLSKPILENKASITFPIYSELLPQKGIKSAISAFTLGAIPRKKDDYFVKIIPSGGYSYNRNLDKTDEYLYSESAPGMCVFAKTSVLKDIKLRDEMWVEIPEYALRDDAILIYKGILQGYKSIGVKNILINHLDAGSSENNRNLKAAYANGFNHVLFWKRFIKSNRKGMIRNAIANILILHWSISSLLYLSTKLIVTRDFELFKVSVKGIFEGFKYSNKSIIDINS